MDLKLKQLIDIKLEKTKKALENNQFEVYIVEKDEVNHLIDTLIVDKSSCTVGGSVTLSELSILDTLKNKDIVYYDRYDSSIDAKEVFRKAFECDYYITSSNAITEDGQLYNIDGNGNRVAAMIYGPSNVIVVAGYNKVVKDMEAAEKRLQEIAAPANCLRLNRETPCVVTGSCMDCKSPKRICSSFVRIARSHEKNRIKVILVKEHLGY